MFDLVSKSFNLNLNQLQKNRLLGLLPELLKRVNLYTEIQDDIEWVTNKDFICKEKTHKETLKTNSIMFKEISLLLKNCTWSKDKIDITLKEYIVDKNLKFKDIGYPLRIALTGKPNAPDLVSVIYELGCEIVINRLNYQY